VPEVGLPAGWAVLGEAGCTFLLVTLIFVMAAHRRTQPLTPFTMPPLFCLLVWLEAPLSGTSTNLARSLGPALLAGVLPQQWVYVLGPGLGAVIAVALLQLEMFARHHPLEARLFHFRLSL
jgi:aquaporin Z